MYAVDKVYHNDDECRNACYLFHVINYTESCLFFSKKYDPIKKTLHAFFMPVSMTTFTVILDFSLAYAPLLTCTSSS